MFQFLKFHLNVCFNIISSRFQSNMVESKNRPAGKPNIKYSQQQLICAIQEVKNGVTQFAAAKKYNIPRSTLFNKISGKALMGKKSGPGTVLSSEEENIVKKWMFTLGIRGFPVTKTQLLRSIQLYLNIHLQWLFTVTNECLPILYSICLQNGALEYRIVDGRHNKHFTII